MQPPSSCPSPSLPALSAVAGRLGLGRPFHKHAILTAGLLALAVAGPLSLTRNAANADDYPVRSVTLVVPFPPGSSPDGIARILAAKLTDRLGKSFVVDNRPGASSLLGTGEVAKAVPDGYTLLVGGSSSFATGPALRKVSPYDAAREFVPLAMVGHVPFVLVVNPLLPAHSVRDLIALAKAKPGELSYGSGGPGHTAHIYAELLKSMTGIQMVHVPYKGSPPALNDVVGGHIQLMFGDVVPSLPLIAERKVRALAVSSNSRLASAPDIPTVAEAGVPGFHAAAWIMVVAPAKTPAEVLGKLRLELAPMLAGPDVQAWITRNGMIPAKSQDPEELHKYMSSEYTRWRSVLEKIGIAGSQ